ncbi:MAG: hypothetical protein SFW09_07805 [Hyphomicrobiaceae bacterium]|nr:hypothetical protein [Hyphomicrobiaceae bacterium]
MKSFVAVLIILATLKIGTQHYFAATVKDEVIVAAYKDRAAGACEQAAKVQRLDPQSSWTRASDIRLVIGKGSLDVQLWQLDNALWQARFRNPYLFLTLSAPNQKLFCEFDIVQGGASVFRM